MAVADLTVALIAAVFAAAALLFAIAQTVASLATFLASSNRCGRRITGAFDLRAGIWFSLNTMSANPRYRMPVLTMPGLRRRIPTMERSISQAISIKHGRSFSSTLNCYIDERRSRILGPGSPDYKALDRPKTILHFVAAILWLPIGCVASLLIWLWCCPCCTRMACRLGPRNLCTRQLLDASNVDADCGGCEDFSCVQMSLLPMTWPFDGVRHHADTSGGVDTHISASQTPGLEAGCWVQFLMSHQPIWWGYADLRWEWRLASLIPADVYGANMETTVADLQLLAVLAGMAFVDDAHLLAATRCGEQISLGQHGSLGRMAYYRSTRENVQTRIEIRPPKTASQWACHCIEACRSSRADGFAVAQRYAGEQVDRPPEADVKNRNLHAVIAQLARRRTRFDAQLPFSCGSAMWIFGTRGFQAAIKRMGSFAAGEWTSRVMRSTWGPLGKGVNACSCSKCCDEWAAEGQGRGNRAVVNDVLKWQALRLSRHDYDGHDYDQSKEDSSTVPVVGCVWTNGIKDEEDLDWAEVRVEQTKLCHSKCGEKEKACRCGVVTRLVDFAADEEDDYKVLAAVALNTKWLGEVSRDVLIKAAESLLLLEYEYGSPGRNVEVVAMVMAYTEYLLLKVRRRIGATNMWDAPASPTLEDFSLLVFGS